MNKEKDMAMIIDEVEWTLELNISCPKCENYFNYLTSKEYLNSSFEYIRHAETNRDINLEATCPECGTEIIITSIIG